MKSETFLDGRVALNCGNCLEVLKGLHDASVDSVVTDPPYHLQSIHKRFAAKGRDETSERYAAGPYGRTAKGFMGKQWDGGDIAFRPELWTEVLRVLKPGGHLVAFGGTRTYHRMAVAIEDAGFEIRDMIGWLYGSGFPKSHDVSKGIDRMQGTERETRAVGKPVKRMIPGADQNKAGWEKTNGREYVPSESDPATPEAQAWEGWGTALKPAQEPICLARKPLIGTVAQNVLEHGTGALNIDECRVDGAGNKTFSRGAGDRDREQYRTGTTLGSAIATDIGRWPANVVHDGSDEVVGAFPSESSVTGKRTDRSKSAVVVGTQWLSDNHESREHTDTGSPARFFYTAKADADDRLGSKHPTVKPLDLMQYLVRLVTPPGGTVLDPFAGTGTTGEAAWREGFNAVLIERETEYQADIRRRMKLCLSGPDERARESIKAKLADKPIDAGPLFGGG